MAVSGVNGGSQTSNNGSVASDQQGFAGLTADHFMKLLITQLQNQDPMEPVGNEQLLNQLSIMRNLQANIELTDSLKGITSNQQLSTAAGFIGKTVTGMTADQEDVTGVAERAFLREGAAYVAVGSKEIPLANVTSVTAA